MASVKIAPRGEVRLRRGHPWVYASDVTEASAVGGDVVRVLGAGDRFLGQALYSDRSQLAVRLLTRDDRPIDSAFLAERLDTAIVARNALSIDGDAWRVVHAEGDLMPSLVVDRYGDVLVVQATSQGMARLLPLVVKLLVERFAPRGVLARHDVRARKLEGLSQAVEVLHGEVPESLVVRDGEVRFRVDPRRGQKTGALLDQRENYLVAKANARGRTLDAFSYDGGFALRVASVCDSVTALDVSGDALRRLAENAAENRLSNLVTIEANAFDVLREADRAGETFDTVILDPPAFAPARGAVQKALRGYKELNLRAMKLLAPGGMLVTCSCSYHVTAEIFREMLADAAADVRATFIVLEERGQSRDHPTRLGVPETGYLKCTVLREIA